MITYDIENYWNKRSLLHDAIKILYVREGYLPNYPPHLISDEEMCNAFLPIDTDKSVNQIWSNFQLLTYGTSFFKDKYPAFDDALTLEYQELVKSIIQNLLTYCTDLNDNRFLPNWVYSYMLGAVIGPKSKIADIHDFLVSIDNDNLEDLYEASTGMMCYNLSSRWLARLPESSRPPSMFAEPHVLKFIRLLSADEIIEMRL